MSENEIEEELLVRGMRMQYAPWGVHSPWEDATIPIRDLTGGDGSLTTRLKWAEWTASWGSPFDLRRVIDVTAWRLRLRDSLA